MTTDNQRIRVDWTDLDIPKGWTVRYSPKSIPSRRFDYDFWHDDFDEVDAGNHLSGTASSVADAIEQIKYIEAESSIP